MSGPDLNQLEHMPVPINQLEPIPLPSAAQYNPGSIEQVSTKKDETVASEQETPVEEIIPREPYAPSETVIQTEPVYVDPLTDNVSDLDSTLCVPGEETDRLIEARRTMRPVTEKSTYEEQDFEVVSQLGYEHATTDDYLVDATKRPGSQFKQSVKSERGPLTAARPRFNDDDSAILKGEQAVLRVRAMMGMGGLLRIPLWHSGFWIMIKTPSDGELLELERRIVEEKVLLGRMTNGLLFSNTSVYIANHLMNFAVEHIHSTTLKDSTNIGEKISTHDIQHVAWGLACAIWPNGYTYARAVLGRTDNENKVIRGKINLGKLQWTDTTSLTDWQIKHMAKIAANSMTDQDVEKYKSEFLRGQVRQVIINEKLKINLHVPNMTQYIIAGQTWINGIVAMTDRVFGMEQDQEVRDDYIMSQGSASFLRQYSHWIESIDVSESTIKDQDTLDQILSDFSSDDTLRRKIVQEIKQYINDSTVSLIAVPTASESEENQLPKAPHLLPIDAMNTFFTLLIQKMRNLRART